MTVSRHADPPRDLRLPARREGPVRRRPQARSRSWSILSARSSSGCAVCPEVELGLGTPREALRLVRRDDDIRMVNTRSGRDISDADARLRPRSRVEALAAGAPGRVRAEEGLAELRHGTGEALRRRRPWPSKQGPRAVRRRPSCERFPHLPVEEEGRLSDPAFATTSSNVCLPSCVCAPSSSRAGPWAISSGSTRPTRWRCSPTTAMVYDELGRLVAARRGWRARTSRRVRRRLHGRAREDRRPPASTPTCCMHMLGHFKTSLDDESRARDCWRASRTTGRTHSARRAPDALQAPRAPLRRRRTSPTRCTSIRTRKN